MIKHIFLIILIIALVVLFGTWPLSILGKVFEWLGSAISWLAGAINFFGWNGIV